MMSIAEECLKILSLGEMNVTIGGRRGPYRVDELENKYEPNDQACGISMGLKREEEDAN